MLRVFFFLCAQVHKQFAGDQKEFCKNFVNHLLPFRPEDPTVLKRTQALLDAAKPDELRFIRYGARVLWFSRLGVVVCCWLDARNALFARGTRVCVC
jgi:hypothetical protein